MAETKNRQGIKVLITGAILQLFLGIIYVWSKFAAPVAEYFKWDANSTKLTASFMLSCFVLGILASGRLQLKVKTSIIVLIGGLLTAVGMLITSFIPLSTPWLIYITYGIMGGFGVGMAYNAIISSAQKWFPKKRGMATGISVCMFGFSTVIFAPLVEILIKNFELMPTFMILSAAFFIATMALFSFIKLPDDTNSQSSAASAISEQKQYTTGEMLKTKQFYFITLSMMFMTASFFIMNPSLNQLSLDSGFSNNAATMIIMMTGITNALGRLAVPLLAEKIGKENATLSIIAATALFTVFLCFAEGILFVISIGVIAFCYGGSSGVYPLVTSDHFGIKNVGSNYGAIMVGFALSALFFPMIINNITDWVVKFIVLAVIAALGAVMIILLSASKKKFLSKEK